MKRNDYKDDTNTDTQQTHKVTITKRIQTCPVVTEIIARQTDFPTILHTNGLFGRDNNTLEWALDNQELSLPDNNDEFPAQFEITISMQILWLFAFYAVLWV